MSRKSLSAAEVLAQVLQSDSESVQGDDYGNDSDFETEGSDYEPSTSSNDESDTEPNRTAIRDAVLPGPSGESSSRGKGGRGRQRGIGRPRNRVVSQPGWTQDTSNFTEEAFAPTATPGPRNMPDTINVDTHPCEYLSLFWDDALWELLLSETNRQVASLITMKPNSYIANALGKKAITMLEFRAFFGLRVSMEMLIHKDRYEFYWRSKDSNICLTPGFPNVMPRNRFLAIWSCLHAVDESDPDLNKDDKIYKVRPVFDHLLSKFKHYYVPREHLSLDEGMIPTKNKLSFKQYIKDKPIRWGIKTFLLCDSENGYIANAEVYTGKQNNANVIDTLGVTGNLVVRMTEEYAGQNYTVYTDRFYTSVELAEHLNTKKIRLCGTAMTNRRRFPKQLMSNSKQMRKGEYELLYHNNVAAIVWKDKRPIYFVTSVYISSPPQHVLRYDPTEHRRVPIVAPKAVKAYNDFMGGTDKNDQLTRLHKCRRHYKWPRRLFMKFFMWATYNAYVLMGFVKPQYSDGRRAFTFHLFVESVCEKLVCEVRSNNSAFGRRVSDTVDRDHRLLRDAHHDVERPAHATQNNRCRVCREKYLRAKKANPNAKDKDLPKRQKTVFWCKSCQEFLCIGSESSNCWYNWHHKVEY